MDRLTDQEIARALAVGKEKLTTEPHAKAARYDPQANCVAVTLTNGCTFTFPADLVPDLKGLNAAQLSDIEVLGLGSGLYWPSNDVALSVPGLLSGLFGTRSQMARLAGATRTPAKSAAARANGTKGGRPRKVRV
jgi:hypothetical protein